MKNACIVLNFSSATSFSYQTALNALRAVGIPVEEVRIFLSVDERKAKEALVQYKQEYDNVFVLTDKKKLSFIRTLILGVVEEESFGEKGNGIFKEKDKTLFLLSADGSETGAGFASAVQAYLEKKYAMRMGKLVVRSVGASEERIDSLIAEAKKFDRSKMQYFHTRNVGDGVLEIFYDDTAPKLLVDDITRLFVEGLGDTVYALDDTPLANQLVKILKLRGKRISVAESFTGGGIAKSITSVSGASEVYFEGLNTYNEESKQKRLGVSEYTLRTQGAVSDQTAYEMAAGLIATGDCDISIATTGLAGPNTDKSMLPVGLCYIAIGTKEKVFVYRYKFEGSREEISSQAIHYAMYLAYKQLKNM